MNKTKNISVASIWSPSQNLGYGVLCLCDFDLCLSS